MTETSLLRLSNLGIGYGGRRLLGDIQLDIHRGDFWALVGPNGAGKSTLLRSIMGQEKPIEGSVHVSDECCIGYVPQRPRVDPIYPITVLEMVRLGGLGSARKPNAKLFGRWRTASAEQSLEALDRLGVRHLANRALRDLSIGQQQRVMMARAMVRKPDLLVLDEPTDGMDLPSEAELFATLGKWNEKHHTTLLVVVHQVSLVADCASHVALINKDLGVFTSGTTPKLLTSQRLSELYGVPIEVTHQQDRCVIRGVAP